MFIIFGTKVRHQKIDDGSFYCPRCQHQRYYDLKVATTFFSLYFIPLIPIKRLGEYIECQTCKTSYQPEMRYMERPQPASQLSGRDLAGMINSVKQRLESGYPVEYMVRDLTAAGIERSVAQTIITNGIGPGRKACKTCGLTYSLFVRNCANCGGTLQS